jgi:glutathione peroxidase-family protein
MQFSLLGVDGEHHALSSLAGHTATAVVFVGNGCPTVRAYEDRLMALQDAYRSAGVRVVAINANNPHLSPPDTFSEMVKRATERKFNFPYLTDADGAVAKRFGAICTPHAFVLDGELKVVYSGRIDDSRIGDKITSRDLENALTDLVAGRPVAVRRTDPFGCGIVW